MRRPHIRMAVGIAAGIAAFAATTVLALTRNGVAMPAAAGPLGPEQVPIPAAAPLGRVRLVARGRRIDGIIHTESPIDRTYTLGEFFDIWGQRLDRDHVGPARGTVTALVNGRVFTGDPRRIPLLAHAQIQLDVGRPVIAAEHIAFPKGL